MMELICSGRRKKGQIKFRVEKCGAGSLIVQAYGDRKMKKGFLHIFPTGVITRFPSAEIGEFRFDSEGKILIE